MSLDSFPTLGFLQFSGIAWCSFTEHNDKKETSQNLMKPLVVVGRKLKVVLDSKDIKEYEISL